MSQIVDTDSDLKLGSLETSKWLRW